MPEPKIDTRTQAWSSTNDGADIGFWPRALIRLFGRLEIGRLTVIFANGRQLTLIGKQAGPVAVLRFNDTAGIRRILFGGDMGFAEAYMDGLVDCPDLVALIKLAALNEDAVESRLKSSMPLRIWHRFRHLLRANSRRGSKRNIAYHYDLGNRFYEQWLDPTMTYSAALFTQPDQSLESAQRTKYIALAKCLSLKPGDHVLEIGCGWGGFAEIAAGTYGAKVTALTLSEQQARFTRERMARLGLGDLVEVRLQDYRDVDGTFDAVASIEMFEAVGEEHWPLYFRRVKELLKPSGKAALQIITINDERFKTYRKGCDFIQRYIFPGGMLPSPTILAERINDADLRLGEVKTFGADYATTLKHWQRKFQHAWPEIQPLGFDGRFKRMWEYYLAYCEAGFSVGTIDVAHLTVHRDI